MKQGALIGIVQGLCLPFRGFSRSGATISTGLLAGVEKSRAESVQLRSRRGAHSRGGRTRSPQTHEGRTHRRRTQPGVRHDAEHSRDAVRVCRWARGTQMAQQVARE